MHFGCPHTKPVIPSDQKSYVILNEVAAAAESKTCIWGFHIDRYPWFRLVPLKVSAEFADLVLREVAKRGGEKAAVQWIQELQSHHFDD